MSFYGQPINTQVVYTVSTHWYRMTRNFRGFGAIRENLICEMFLLACIWALIRLPICEILIRKKDFVGDSQNFWASKISRYTVYNLYLAKSHQALVFVCC